MKIRLLATLICAAGLVLAQSNDTSSSKHLKRHTSAKHDIGSGAGDIGKGAGKGIGSAAKGTGKAAADLVTLHPVDAATDLGRGAAGAGKNIGVGAVKGTGKIMRGAGKAIKHIF
jgi:hypothetical protein